MGTESLPSYAIQPGQPERCCHRLSRDWPTGPGQEVPRGPLPLPDPPSAPVCPRLLLRCRLHPDSRPVTTTSTCALCSSLCPKTHPVRVCSALCETTGDQSDFSHKSSLWPGRLSPPLWTASLNDIPTCSLPADDCFVFLCLRGKHHPRRSHKPDDTPVIVPHEASTTPAVLRSFPHRTAWTTAGR